jgi:DNA-binding Lrp family transcriptional regulator
MTNLQKMILNEIQKGIPLEERPFLVVAKKLNISEKEVIDCINELKEKNYIRRFGALLNVNKVGIVSTLICMKVEKKQLEKVAAIINEYEGVTHNYERDDEYNVWFTLMESSYERLEKNIEEIKERTGVKEILNLSNIKKYKTKVFFRFE